MALKFEDVLCVGHELATRSIVDKSHDKMDKTSII